MKLKNVESPRLSNLGPIYFHYVMIDYAFTAYGNAVHSFTDKNAGDDPSKGFAYNEKADMRSWESLVNFLAELIPLPMKHSPK
jgi:dienelactone hydrolase